MTVTAGSPGSLTARLGARVRERADALLAMLIGGLVGMLSAFAVVDTEPRQWR